MAARCTIVAWLIGLAGCGQTVASAPPNASDTATDMADSSTLADANGAVDAATLPADAATASSLADATTADVAGDATATDAAPAAADVGLDATSLTAGPCPASDAGPVGALPPLTEACPDPLPQVWLDAGLDPQPTLAVELGQYVTEGFAPYQDGGWAPIIHGWQGLTHVPGDLRVTVPGSSGKSMNSSQVRIGKLDCEIHTGTSQSSHGMVPVGPEQWGKPTDVTLAVLDVPGFESWKLCGRWLDLRVLVRVPDGRWGKQRIRLRLWDTEPTQPKKP